MREMKVKTHLIITDTHHEYHIKWIGKILDARPKIKNGLPIFVIVGGKGRMEINTIDMARVEKCAKLMTNPRGRSAVTTDTSRIFIKEVDDNEMLLGVLTHNYVKTYAPMYDKVGYKED